MTREPDGAGLDVDVGQEEEDAAHKIAVDTVGYDLLPHIHQL